MAASYNCVFLSSSMNLKAVPCGPLNETAPVISCCVLGDYCLSHNLCGYTHSTPGGYGYYTSACSDGQFSNTAVISGMCTNRCADIILPDVTYDSNRGVWECCAFPNGIRDCQNPTNETFLAAAPSDLITYWTAGATTSIATTSQKQSTEPTSSSIGSLSTTPAISTTTNLKINSVPTVAISTDSSGSSLSTRAVTGIIVSSIIAGVALMLVIVLLMRNRRLNQRFEEKDDIVNPNTSQSWPQITSWNREDQQHHELLCYPQELPEQPRNPSISA
ncbi:hypothetical protein V8E54_010836 [Elaphomyces granulatus]